MRTSALTAPGISGIGIGDPPPVPVFQVYGIFPIYITGAEALLGKSFIVHSRLQDDD
jgi:hypothetical protein